MLNEKPSVFEQDVIEAAKCVKFMKKQLLLNVHRFAAQI